MIISNLLCIFIILYACQMFIILFSFAVGSDMFTSRKSLLKSFVPFSWLIFLIKNLIDNWKELT